MKYLLMINSDPSTESADPGELKQWMDYTQEMAEAGVMVAGEALVGPEHAVTVNHSDGVVSDGPFAESKEVMGGFYLIDVPDRDTAVEWAKKMPPTGHIEVRQCAVFD